MSLQVEIAVTSEAGAALARVAGADRVELCTGLELGGLTPSAGLVRLAVDTGAEVHVLVRPRAGDFVHLPHEIAQVEADLVWLADQDEVHGVVIGALTEDDQVDLDLLTRWTGLVRDLAPELQVTVHRAVDHAADPVAAVDAVADLADRVLTSGGAPRVADGMAALARMVEVTRGRCQVMAGGGLQIEDIPRLAGIGVDAVHLSAKAVLPGRGGVPLGAGDDGSWWAIDPAVVLAAVEAARATG